MLYRATGGRFVGRFGRAPVLLLTTTGRVTGKERVSPLLYLEDGERLVLVASNGGHPRHPAWFRNLEANPEVKVTTGKETRPVRARVCTSEEKVEYWPRLVALYGSYASYQRRTERDIPIVLLDPR